MASTNLVAVAESLLENIKKLECSPDPVGNDLREAVVQAARTILREASDPIQTMRAEWVTLGNVAAWNIFLEWQVFDHIPAEGSISYGELAELVGAEESLIARISAILVATGTLQQPAPGRLRHSRVSRLYVSASPASDRAWVACALGMKAYAHWPEFFAARGRRAPRSHTATPLALAWGRLRDDGSGSGSDDDADGCTVWDILARDATHARRFAASMTGSPFREVRVTGPGAVYDFAWVAAAAAVGIEKERPLLVDVGGGKGQLLREIRGAFPAIPAARCVLQDRREVIEEAVRAGGDSDGDDALAGARMMAHDFLEAQPVKGALVYLVRRILLDWPDELCIRILSHLAEALPADDPQARVLIIEPRKIYPPRPSDAIIDLVMLNMGGKLRDAGMLARLVSAAGLRIVKVHAEEDDDGHVVECAKV